jgi:hypothetical protein
MGEDATTGTGTAEVLRESRQLLEAARALLDQSQRSMEKSHRALCESLRTVQSADAVIDRTCEAFGMRRGETG